MALSRGLPRVAVSHHLALRSPDFPRYFRNAVIQATLQYRKDTCTRSCNSLAISRTRSTLLISLLVKSIDIKPRLVDRQPSTAVGCSG